jgi:hypothetical protein
MGFTAVVVQGSTRTSAAANCVAALSRRTFALAVRVEEVADQGFLVRWDGCGQHLAPQRLVGIRVTKRTEGAQATEGDVCVLMATAKANFESWLYASTPSGTKLTTCQPLLAGQVYNISVKTSFVGSQRFRIEADGTVRLLEGLCF